MVLLASVLCTTAPTASLPTSAQDLPANSTAPACDCALTTVVLQEGALIADAHNGCGQSAGTPNQLTSDGALHPYHLRQCYGTCHQAMTVCRPTSSRYKKIPLAIPISTTIQSR